MTLPTVISVCGDPGGGAALLPVLDALVRAGRVELVPFAYRQSFELLQRNGIAVRPVPQGADSSWFDETLRALPPRLILTATSHNGEDHERAFIAAARAQGVPSLSLLDFWSNYAVRFAGQIPDRIAVMDEAARDGAVRDGLPAERIVITGHPSFDALARQRAAFTAEDREAQRGATGTTSDELQVLFASQPLRLLYGAEVTSPDFLGYDEHSVLDELVAALERVSRRTGARIVLVIRPHPRENPDAHAARRSNAIRIVVSSRGEPRAAAMASDLLVGMTTMLLVEAGYLGCRALSLQLDSRVPSPYPADIGSRLATVRDAAEIESALGRLIDSSAVAPALPADAGMATANVMRVIHSMLQPA